MVRSFTESLAGEEQVLGKKRTGHVEWGVLMGHV